MAYYAILVGFYALYFGLLGRDLVIFFLKKKFKKKLIWFFKYIFLKKAEFCADRMAQTLGYAVATGL